MLADVHYTSEIRRLRSMLRPVGTALYPVVIFYAIFALGKARGSDVPTDLPKLHALMGAAFLLFGASVSHCMTLLHTLRADIDWRGPSVRFWLASTIGFLGLFIDASLGFHEAVSGYIPEALVFVTFGLFFAVILFSNWRLLSRTFWTHMLLFVTLSVTAVFGDMSADGEGVIVLFGETRSYEQACETFACLVLASAFTVEAWAQVGRKLPPMRA
jgi:hypothetical protein